MKFYDEHNNLIDNNSIEKPEQDLVNYYIGDFKEDRNAEILVKINEVILVVGMEYKTVTYEDFKAIKTIPYSKNQNIILAENESIEIRTYYKILYENKLYDLIFSIDSTYCDRLFHLLKEVKA
jgi:hypothetical protein